MNRTLRTLTYLTLACAMTGAAAFTDDMQPQPDELFFQKVQSLDTINEILVELAEAAHVEGVADDLMEAAASHYEAWTGLHRARVRKPEAWNEARLAHREAHDEALLAFNDHLKRLTPEGRRMPSNELIELCLAMFGRASGIEYVHRDFWTDASVRLSGSSYTIADGDTLVIRLEDGMTRGLRSTMHPIRTVAYITLDPQTPENQWIELALGRTLHVGHFSGYSPGALEKDNLENASVRIIERDDQHIVLEAELLGEIMDTRHPNRKKTDLDFRGRFTLRLAEKPCG